MSNIKNISTWLQRKIYQDLSDSKSQWEKLKAKFQELNLLEVIEFEKSIQAYIEILWEASTDSISKFGGNPDLPVGVKWPVCGGIPMAFIGQIELAGIGSKGEDELTQRGVLYFFLNLHRIENLSDDFIGNEMYFFGENIKVIHHQGNELSQEQEIPVGIEEKYVFKEAYLSFKHSYMPVPPEVFPDLELEEHDDYCEEYCDIDLYSGKNGLFFYPFSYQEGLSESYREMLAEMGKVQEEEEIITLLTFDCFDEKEVFHSLNDLGFHSGYFGIKTADLQEGNFDNVVFCFQS